MNDPVYNEIVVSDILSFSEMKKLKNGKLHFLIFIQKSLVQLVTVKLDQRCLIV